MKILYPSNSKAKANSTLVALMALLVIGSAWLSVSNASHSLWYDEALTAKIVYHGSLKEVFFTSFSERPYPPLYFLIAHGSIKFANNEFGLRFPSVIFGMLALVAIFLLGKVLFDDSIGCVSALLFLSTPGIFRAFVDANPYTMLVFSTTASTYCLYKAVASRSIRHWVGFVLFSLVGLGTHLFAIFYLIGQIIAAFYLTGSWKLDRSKNCLIRFLNFIRKERHLFICSAIILGIWVLWMGFYFSHKGLTRSFDFQKIFSAKTFVLCPALYFGYLSKGKLMQLVVWPILQLFGSIRCFIEERTQFIFILILIIIPTLCITFAQVALLPFFAYRYGIGMFPLACILSACSVRFLRFSMVDTLKRKVTIVLIFLCFMFYIVSGFVTIFEEDNDLFEIQDWRGAAHYLRSNVNKDDRLFFVQSWRYPSLEFYFETPSKLYLVDNDKELAERARAFLKEGMAGPGKFGHVRFWIVLNSLENKNPFIEKFFGNEIPAREKSEMLIKKLRNEFKFENVDARHFKRVSIVSFAARE